MQLSIICFRSVGYGFYFHRISDSETNETLMNVLFGGLLDLALMKEIMDPKKGKISETFLSISRRELGNSIFNSARILTFP